LIKNRSDRALPGAILFFGCEIIIHHLLASNPF